MATRIAGRLRSTLPHGDDHPYRSGPWQPMTVEYDAEHLDTSCWAPASLSPH